MPCLFAQRHTTQRADPRDADNRNKGEGGDVKTPKAPPPLDPRVGSVATIVMQTACLPASLAHSPSPDGVMLHGRRRTTRRSQNSSRWVHSRPARGDARRRGNEWLEGCATRRCFWLAPLGATVASSPASRGVETSPFLHTLFRSRSWNWGRSMILIHIHTDVSPISSTDVMLHGLIHIHDSDSHSLISTPRKGGKSHELVTAARTSDLRAMHE